MLHQIGGYQMNDMTEKEQPVSSFIKLERYNSLKLIASIHSGLTSLAKVLKGKAIITTEARQLASSLLKREVGFQILLKTKNLGVKFDYFQTPTAWLSLCEGPLDPLDYLSSIVSKAASVERWYLKVKSSSDGKSLFRDSLDLSDLFTPSIFLNAFRQQTAR